MREYAYKGALLSRCKVDVRGKERSSGSSHICAVLPFLAIIPFSRGFPPCYWSLLSPMQVLVGTIIYISLPHLSRQGSHHILAESSVSHFPVLSLVCVLSRPFTRIRVCVKPLSMKSFCYLRSPFYIIFPISSWTALLSQPLSYLQRSRKVICAADVRLAAVT